MPPGVKGLAAMFEQRGENNSPDDRGRSPGPARSLGSPAPESPRPLSKIRSSFVAIEKDGRVGLRRERSGDSVSVSSRRVSNDTGTTTPQPVSEKSDVFAENMAQNAAAFESNLSQLTSPKSVKQTPSPSKFSPKTPRKGDTTPDIAPNPNPDKITDEETKAKLKPGMPTDKAAVQGDQHTSNGIGDILKPTAPTSKVKATISSKPAPKFDLVSTTSTKPAPRALKSPVTITAAKSSTKEPVRASSAAPEKKAAPRASSAAPETKATSRATSASRERHATASKTAASKPAAAASKKPAAVTPPSGTGFAKPKPRSPTRPVKLPSSLTTPTAASAAKFGNGTATAASPGRRPVSRASGGTTQNVNANPASHRPHSRTGVSAAAGTTSSTKTLKRQSSTVGRPRPSLGPPPKQPAKDHPVAKREAHVDESFLARMMRPTQASANKTAEKSPLSPPRKHNAPAPAQPRRQAAKDIEGNAKKAAAKLQGPGKPKPVTGAAKKATADEPKKTAKEVAPVVAQAETAEEAIETAKASKETAATPLVEKAEAEVPIEPTARGVAPIAAQAETAEAAIEAAKVSTNTAVTPLVEKTEPEAVVESTTTEEAKAPQDQTRPLSRPVSPVPTATAAPEKVEDIEELAKETVKERLDKTAPEDGAAEATAAGDAKEAAVPSTVEAEKLDQAKPNEEATEA
ncbi:hypothetical protein DL764_008510 [Monosporascus ibericus]|uniref:Mucin-7 n=1 Tax=Monosporascus ibericus TaxID=155417 RepID=A0A4Q4T043_9PEZI|nr:hypothetical protein DL764_008510 [Monosporascus ibericus]